MRHGLPLRWAGALDPADAVIGIVHALAVGVVAYLLGAAVLEAAVSIWARRAGRPAGRRRVQLPWASTVVRRVAGLGLALSVGAGVAASLGGGGRLRRATGGHAPRGDDGRADDAPGAHPAGAGDPRAGRLDDPTR